MPRVPAHLERIAGGGKRQQIWTWLRAHRDQEWTVRDVAASLDFNQETTREYLHGLLHAGFLEVVREEQRAAIKIRYLRLVRDNGVHAPRVDRHGKPVVMGRVNDAMWGTMRRVDRDWDFRELAGLASTDEFPVQHLTARSYVIALAQAGYLIEVKPPVLGKYARPGRYRLKPIHAKKPLAPQLQRVGAVYDPNEGRIVWVEEVDPNA